MPPPPRFFRFESQRAGVKTTRRLVRARLSPPVVGGNFYSNGAVVFPPPPIFPFRTGAAAFTLPPFDFVSFRTGWHSRCPRFVSFRTGRRIHAAPVSFRFERGGVNTPPPLSFCFKLGQHESHALPPVSFRFERGRVNSTNRPRFFLFTPQY